ncbi:TIGR02265 family protein [Archangium minus]
MEDRPQLLARLARCKQEHRVPGMFLGSVLASADALGPEVAELARREIADGERLVENYRYPLSWMLRMLDIIGQAAVVRGGSYGEALYKCGRDAGLAYIRSSVGRMRAMVASASGLHRALEGIPSAVSLAVNFGEVSYRRLSPCSGELVFKQDLIGVSWNTGMVVVSTAAALGRSLDELKFESIPTDEDASSFLLRICW